MCLGIGAKIVNDWLSLVEPALVSSLVTLIVATNFNVSYWKITLVSVIHTLVFYAR